MHLFVPQTVEDELAGAPELAAAMRMRSSPHGIVSRRRGACGDFTVSSSLDQRPFNGKLKRMV